MWLSCGYFVQSLMKLCMQKLQISSLPTNSFWRHEWTVHKRLTPRIIGADWQHFRLTIFPKCQHILPTILLKCQLLLQSLSIFYVGNPCLHFMLPTTTTTLYCQSCLSVTLYMFSVSVILPQFSTLIICWYSLQAASSFPLHPHLFSLGYYKNL